MRETLNSRAANAGFANPDADSGSFDRQLGELRAPSVAAAPPQSTGTVVATNRVPLKRPLTLDLNAKLSNEGETKRLRFNSSVNADPAPVLNTPDLQILKMTSPSLEKFMIGPVPTPTPSILCPTKVR